MSVLPSSVTLYSFFIVFVGLILVTAFIGMFLIPVLDMLKSTGKRTKSHVELLLRYLKTLIPRKYYRETLLNLLNPSTDLKFRNMNSSKKHRNGLYNIAQWFLRRLPARIVHDYLVPIVLLPDQLWRLWQIRGNRFVKFSWSPLTFVRDVILIAFWPVALALLVVFVGYILFVDTVSWMLQFP